MAKSAETKLKEKIKANHRRGIYYGVQLSKVDERILTRALDQSELDTGGKKRDKVERLATHFAKMPEASLCRCDDCGGISAEEAFNCCPYCGLPDPDLESLEGSDPDDSRLLPVRDTEGYEVSQDVDVSEIPISVDELDRRVKMFLRLKSQTALNIYRLGAMLRKMKESGLWTLRVTSDGKQVHRSFTAFAKGELGVSPTYTEKLMRLAANLAEDQVKGLEPGHVQVLMQVPKRLMPAMAERARTRSPRQVEREAREIAEENRSRRPLELTATVTAEPITKTATRRPRHADEDPTPARSIDEDPFVEIEHLNGIVETIRVGTNRAGEIVLTVEYRRGS